MEGRGRGAEGMDEGLFELGRVQSTVRQSTAQYSTVRTLSYPLLTRPAATSGFLIAAISARRDRARAG